MEKQMMTLYNSETMCFSHSTPVHTVYYPHHSIVLIHEQLSI
ncbi:unnamed protein product [Brassica oleracea]